MRSPYILSADKWGAISLEFCGKPSTLEADAFLGAYYKSYDPRKAMDFASPRLPKSDEKREKGYEKVTEKESELPTILTQVMADEFNFLWLQKQMQMQVLPQSN